MIAEYSGNIPKESDRVGTAQQGVFEVVDINSLMQTANGQNRLTDKATSLGMYLWTSLKLLDKK